MFQRCSWLFWIVLAWLSVLPFPARITAAEQRTGEQIYRQLCSRCHGGSGKGTNEKYPHSLIGNRSVAQLTRYIAKTMPEDDPGKCVGEDARKVAAYIYETFYSKEAQARRKPPRIELARLTVRQYRNTVADLAGSFRAVATNRENSVSVSGLGAEQHGLQGEYFKSRRTFATIERVLERLDPAVQFDFGTSGPDPERFEANQFSIRWQGSVLAPETGDYEFIVRTEHAARLWLNDLNRPLIDAWVKSGEDTEYRAQSFCSAAGGIPCAWSFPRRSKA